MAELLLELFSEEIPARMQRPMAKQLQEAVRTRLDGAELYYKEIQTFVTPRRLALSVDGLSLTQETRTEETRGPRTDAPQQAIDGFLRSQGLTKEQLKTKTLPKGEFYFAIKEQKGRPTKDMLVEALNEVIPSLTWPKSMRWGSNTVRWVRPLRRMLAVFGGDVLPLSFGPVEAGNVSEGHRFLNPGTFRAESLKLYRTELQKRHVMLSSEERATYIQEKAQAIATEKGLTLVEDAGLLEEVAGLVEWPNVLLGSIDKGYMHLPEEVLISSIRTHQKYFCLRDKNGKLAPHFIVVSNMETADKGRAIIAGNERVLRARLADASFFWNTDRNKPLTHHAEGLERIIFHAKLGTIAEKTNRVAGLASFLSVWVPHANLEQVDRAARLCKADLCTEMVGEFPELQGIMGAYYARDNGEEDSIIQAIGEHYAPQGPSDAIPTLPVSVAVALADKIDTLAGMFAIDEKPTGSKDPFGLRRAALGVIRIIIENRLNVPLRILIEHALKLYPKSLFKQTDDSEDQTEEKPKKSLLKKIRGRKTRPKDVADDLILFFIDRLKSLLKAENVRHDLISAVFGSGNEDDLLRITERVASLTHHLATEDGQNLLAAYRRAANIVAIEEKKDKTTYKGNPSKSHFEAEEEKALFDALEHAEDSLKTALKKHDPEAAMAALASLRVPTDAFFDAVKVNSDTPAIRENRLKLLAYLRELVDQVADFSVIEG